MQYLMGIDLGTSGIKTVLFDTKGTTIASSTKEYPLYQPANGWVEQDPNQWWDACVLSIQQVLKDSSINPADIAGIGFSGQMHGLVLLDKEGNVLRNCIIWSDGRTIRECQEITERVGAENLISISANPALTGFTAGKILWVRRHEPEIYAKVKTIMLPKDFLRYKLTGEYGSDVSDASGTNLLDVPKREWSQEILSILDIDKTLLPPLYESSDVTGAITESAAKLTGLTAGTPVVAGAADNAAAAIGTGVVSQGKAFTTLGTSGVIFSHSDEVAIDPKGRVHTFCSAVPNSWAVMSCTLAAGGSLQWLRNELFQEEMQAAEGLGIDPYQLMDQQAERIPIGADRLLFLPYLMGERSPLLDSNSRGVFFGLSGVHTKYHMLRAVLEGVMYSQRHCLDVFEEMGLSFEQMFTTGGGGKSKLWRQMMTDMYTCPVTTIDNLEGPALGAAILAGVGTGIYDSVEQAVEEIIQPGITQNPIPENTQQYYKFYEIYLSLYPALKNSFEELANLE